MAHVTAKIPTGHRAPTCCETSGAGSPDMVFGFFEVEGEEGFTSESSGSEGSTCDRVITSSRDVEDGNEDARARESSGNGEEERAFWETQHQLLQATLCRTSSLESRIRIAAKAAVEEMKAASGEFCICGRAARATGTGGCRNCLMREVCNRLQDAGFNCNICRTKWRSSPEIPSGEHSFLDVVDIASSQGGEVMRVIIELNFRAEFEMARASEEYRRLILLLPELFVGKVARLQALIKILCSAAKKSMKQNKMHMGPWRKQRYVQAKWLSPACEKLAPSSPPSSSGAYATGTTTVTYCRSGASEPRKPPRKTSMLTMTLLVGAAVQFG